MKACFSLRSRMHVKRGKCLVTVLALLILLGWHSAARAQNSSGHRKVLLRFEPEYPAVLRNGHFEGQVRLEATVSENGNVSKVEVKGGSPIFAKFASQAVAKWKYAPGPTQTTEEVVFNFNSNNK